MNGVFRRKDADIHYEIEVLYEVHAFAISDLNMKLTSNGLSPEGYVALPDASQLRP